MSVFTVERIQAAMVNLATYLEKEAYCYPDADVRTTKALLKKGITSKVYRDEDAYVTTHSFEYYGWTIYIDEEMYAVRLSDGLKVRFPTT